ncbi:MAG TPA: hypothetical protein VD737_09730, partial [Steroidobacteraceae bacterium]|nr:hypothetical protein [Steroidobacteraceae bacterium]
MLQTPTTASAPPPLQRRGRGIRTWVWALLAVAVVLGALYTSLMLWYSYSEGERAGVLQKFSHRGWICKTYEGELAQYVVGGVAPQIWHFSARDAAVVTQLREAVGRQVRIHYEEHRGLPTNCFGETAYFAKSVEVIGPPPAAAAPATGAGP